MGALEPAQLLAFNLALLAAMASPGPAFLMVLRNAIVAGRRAGVLTGLGLALVAAMWTGAALLGLAALFEVVPWLYAAMKIGGALYLLYIAWGLWRGAARPLDPQGRAARGRFVRAGALVNLANPKSVLFAGAVIVVIFPAGLSPGQSALIVANHFGVEVAVYAAMACGLASPPARAAYLRIKALADRVAAGLMAALGLRLLLDR